MLSCIFFGTAKLEKKLQGAVFTMVYVMLFYGKWSVPEGNGLVELWNCILTFERNPLKGNNFIGFLSIDECATDLFQLR